MDESQNVPDEERGLYPKLAADIRSKLYEAHFERLRKKLSSGSNG